MSELSRSKDRLRICILSFMFSPLVGGAEAQAEKHARQLMKQGHDVLVLTLRHERQWQREEYLNGLRVVRVGGFYRRDGRLHIGKCGHLPNDLAMLLALWKFRHEYDVIHAMQLSSLSAIATLICQLAHKPIIISIQSAGPDEQQGQRLTQGAMLMADILDTCSDTSYLHVGAQDWIAGDVEHLARSTLGGSVFLHILRRSSAYYQVLSMRSQRYLLHHRFHPAKVVHIPNGIDTEQFRPALLQPPANRAERDILCVARLEYPKGVDVLLHAWGRMMHAPDDWRRHLRLRLRLVGQGIFRPQMERIAAELGIADSVEFLGLRRDVIDLLQHAWGFVMPSRWEGMPNALLEAMACGLPCVATRVSGSEDIIEHGVNGLLVPPEHPAELARALRCLIEDTTLAQHLAQEARATIVRDYQLSAITEKCLHLYDSVCVRGEHKMPAAQEEMREHV